MAGSGGERDTQSGHDDVGHRQTALPEDREVNERLGTADLGDGERDQKERREAESSNDSRRCRPFRCGLRDAVDQSWVNGGRVA